MGYLIAFLIIFVPMVIGSTGGVAVRAMFHIGGIRRFIPRRFARENKTRVISHFAVASFAFACVCVVAVWQGQEIITKLLEVVGITMTAAGTGTIGFFVGYGSIKFFPTDSKNGLAS